MEEGEGATYDRLIGPISRIIHPSQAGFRKQRGITVESVLEMIGPEQVTAADVFELVRLTKAILRVDEPGKAPTAPIARYVLANALDLVALLIAVTALLYARQSYLQDRAEYARSEPPPSVTVVVERPDADEIERIVDDRLREIEQQRQAEHDADGRDRRGDCG